MSQFLVSIQGDYSSVTGAAQLVDDSGASHPATFSGKPGDAYTQLGQVLAAAGLVNAATVPDAVPSGPPLPDAPDVTSPAFQALSVAEKIATLQKYEADKAAAERAAQEARGISYHVTH